MDEKERKELINEKRRLMRFVGSVARTARFMTEKQLEAYETAADRVLEIDKLLAEADEPWPGARVELDSEYTELMKGE